MKVIIAPDSFKGSLSSIEAAKAIQKGVKKANEHIETVVVPLADGGEGTVQSLVDITNGKLLYAKVHDPLGRKITASYGVLGDNKTAVIEMASASGLPLLTENERNPLNTNTFGTGELILAALHNGFNKFILGLGGSATNDGGTGMAAALGACFIDSQGNTVNPSGQTLGEIHKIDLSNLDPRIKTSEFTIACDVDNPLCGVHGASRVYAPQKGASSRDVEILEKNMLHYANVLQQEFGKNIKDIPGAGAAGGLGAGMIAFLNANLKKGIDILAEIANLRAHIKGADLVITGEGCLDYQTAFGKTPFGVAKIASEYDVPTIAIAGSLGKDYPILYDKGFSGLFSLLNKPMSLTEAIKDAEQLLISTTENVMRFWLSSKRSNNNI